MNASAYRVRRATLEDLRELTALWTTMGFQVEDLARRVTEFQVVEAAGTRLVGAVGLQMLDRQGLLHSEAFLDFSHADAVRPLLWERLNALATNHGLLRFWTREQAPFWRRCGLALADDAAMEKLPAPWRSQPSGWLTLKLREDVDALMAADAELKLFMETERRRSQGTAATAKHLRMFAIALVCLLILALAVATFYLFSKNPNLLFPRR